MAAEATPVVGALKGGDLPGPGQKPQPARRALYFCGSIRGGREDQALYGRIVSRLRRFGAVLTEHVAAAELSARGEAAGRGPRGGRRRCRVRALAPLLLSASGSAPAREGKGPGSDGVYVAMHRPCEPTPPMQLVSPLVPFWRTFLGSFQTRL